MSRGGNDAGCVAEVVVPWLSGPRRGLGQGLVLNWVDLQRPMRERNGRKIWLTQEVCTGRRLLVKFVEVACAGR